MLLIYVCFIKAYVHILEKAIRLRQSRDVGYLPTAVLIPHF